MTAADRLKSARLAAGYPSAAAAARAFGFSPTTYRQHENGTRGFKLADATRYARAFRSTAAYLFTGDSAIDPPQINPASANTVPLMRTAAAGLWLTPDFDRPRPPREIPCLASVHYRGSARFAVILADRSLDRFLPPGSVLITVATGRDSRPAHNSIAIIERYNAAGERETTARVIIERQIGEYWQTPSSHDPAYSAAPLDLTPHRPTHAPAIIGIVDQIIITDAAEINRRL